MNSSMVKFVVLGAVIAVSVVFLVHRMSKPVDVQHGPDVFLFICPRDGSTMTWSRQEYMDFQRDQFGGDVLCPTKGTPMVRASQCPHCEAIFEAQRQMNCPKCRKPLFEVSAEVF